MKKYLTPDIIYHIALFGILALSSPPTNPYLIVLYYIFLAGIICTLPFQVWGYIMRKLGKPS